LYSACILIVISFALCRMLNNDYEFCKSSVDGLAGLMPLV